MNTANVMWASLQCFTLNTLAVLLWNTWLEVTKQMWKFCINPLSDIMSTCWNKHFYEFYKSSLHWYYNVSVLGTFFSLGLQLQNLHITVQYHLYSSELCMVNLCKLKTITMVYNFVGPKFCSVLTWYCRN